MEYKNRKLDPNSKFFNGDKFRKVLKEKGLSILEVERRTGVSEFVLSKILNKKIRVSSVEVEKLREYLKIDIEELYATEAEELDIRKNEQRETEKRSMYYKNSDSTTLKKELEIKSKEIKERFREEEGIKLEGLLFILSRKSIDICNVADKSKIDLERLMEIQAFNECSVEELIKIYSVLFEFYFIFDYMDIIKQEKEIDCPINEQKDYAEYAAELYCETKKPKKYRPIYFWKRSCLSEEQELNYRMPDWFEKYAEKKRKEYIKEKKNRKFTLWRSRDISIDEKTGDMY